MTDSTCIYGGEEYSEGAEMCQGDTIKRCLSGRWTETGKVCSDEGQKLFLKHIPVVPDDQLPTLEKYKRDDGARVKKTLSKYAEFWSIRRSGPYLYFDAAETRGQACAREWGHYQVPLDDVVSIVPDLVNDSPPYYVCQASSVQYNMITYEVPG